MTADRSAVGSERLRANRSRRDLNCGRCMHNGNVVDEDEQLEALYSMRTGRLIPDFPKNLKALDSLPGE